MVQFSPNLLTWLPTLGVTDADLTQGGFVSLLVVGLIFVLLQVRRSTSVELLFVGGLVIVTLAGVITPADALAGFASPPVLLIGALFAAAAGLRTTGALDWLGGQLLGSAKTERSALARLSLVAPVSAVVLNTPLVAMLAPVVIDWCHKRKVSPSRLLIPLSYLTILGGVITVIGTSTTLVCNAKLADSNVASYSEQFSSQLGEIELLEITWVGLPVAIVGVIYLLGIAPKLLPNRTDMLSDFGDRRREYLVEMLVQPNCSMIGQTVEQAGLRNLPGLFLIEISRGDEVITPVTPSNVISSHDRMIFSGVVDTIADLERIPGLVPAVDMTYESTPAERSSRQLAEAVLSSSSPLIGRTVREANFRQRYNAAIVAVHRGGERLETKIGNIRLVAGDTLLLQTKSSFVEAHRNNREFYLVSQVGGSTARRHDRALIAGGLFALLIVWLVGATLTGSFFPETTPSWLDSKIQPMAALAIVLLMIGTRCLTTSQARSAIDLQVLITIAAAMGLGEAMTQSGAADWLANLLVSTASNLSTDESILPWILLAATYLTTMVLTELITNAAVASMMIPLSIGIAAVAGLNPRPFILAVAIAASLSFATPIGYQTNLMVMGPGGYQPRDFMQVGGPLTLLVALIAIILLGTLWSFELA